MDIVYIKTEEKRILLKCNKNEEILDILNKRKHEILPFSVKAFNIEEKNVILLDILNLNVMIEEVDNLNIIYKGVVQFKLLSAVIDIHITFNPELNKLFKTLRGRFNGETGRWVLLIYYVLIYLLLTKK